ncbi:hypothetical protein [Sinanaerobacter chloroacetimidivorans]|nr:hypothetical protein [Sinanaerobacter chloroacetimidivorans]
MNSKFLVKETCKSTEKETKAEYLKKILQFIQNDLPFKEGTGRWPLT